MDRLPCLKRKFSCIAQNIVSLPYAPPYDDKRARPDEETVRLPDARFNAYMTFPNISSLVAALAGLDVFHHVLGPAHAQLEIHAVGNRALGNGNQRVVVPVLHMRASQVRQVHQAAQDAMLENETGRFPLLGVPRGDLVGELVAVRNVHELYEAGARILGLGAVNVDELEALRRRKTDIVVARFFSK